MDDKTCHICSMEYNDDDKITITCGHTFHRFCLLESLKIDKSRHCPYCRSTFPLLTCNDDEQFIKGIHKPKLVNPTPPIGLNVSFCCAILKRGSRKGQECGAYIPKYKSNSIYPTHTLNNFYCKRHSKDI